jgi:cytochrome-b5 reductase
LITLSVQPCLLPPRDSKPIWSVFIKDDDIQVERPYTPLFPPDDDGRLTFWIKRYPHGEVGQWLHSKGVGDIVHLRGPLKTWQWKEDVWDEIIMVCVIFDYRDVFSWVQGVRRNRHHAVLPTLEQRASS